MLRCMQREWWETEPGVKWAWLGTAAVLLAVGFEVLPGGILAGLAGAAGILLLILWVGIFFNQ